MKKKLIKNLAIPRIIHPASKNKILCYGILFSILLSLASPILAQTNPALNSQNQYSEGNYSQRTKTTLPSLWYIITEEFPAGIHHIFTGIDHICFVIALALILKSSWDMFKVVSFFTVAHALTLTLASFELIPIGVLGIAFIEFGVAFSIIWVGVENILAIKRENDVNLKKRRSFVAFFFGLIHGVAFSEHFRQSMLEIDMTQAVNLFKFLLKILIFNLGVDTGQLTVAYLTFFILIWLSRGFAPEKGKKIAQKFTLYVSSIISLMGFIWAIERLSKIINLQN